MKNIYTRIKTFIADALDALSSTREIELERRLEHARRLLLRDTALASSSRVVAVLGERYLAALSDGWEDENYASEVELRQRVEQAARPAGWFIPRDDQFLDKGAMVLIETDFDDPDLNYYRCLVGLLDTMASDRPISKGVAVPPPCACFPGTCRSQVDPRTGLTPQGTKCKAATPAKG